MKGLEVEVWCVWWERCSEGLRNITPAAGMSAERNCPTCKGDGRRCGITINITISGIKVGPERLRSTRKVQDNSGKAWPKSSLCDCAADHWKLVLAGKVALRDKERGWCWWQWGRDSASDRENSLFKGTDQRRGWYLCERSALGSAQYDVKVPTKTIQKTEISSERISGVTLKSLCFLLKATEDV